MNATTLRRVILCFAAGGVSTFLAVPCSAAMFSFERIPSNNGNDNVATQLAVVVSDSGGRVLFELSNAGPLASNVAELYWADDLLLLSNGPDIDASTTSLGVNYVAGPAANPANLPGGNSIGFQADHSIDSANGPPTNGINPGEMIGLLFDGDANAVITAMQAGSLRIGAHVRSISAQGGSDGFVTVAVPEPTAVVLLGSWLGVFILHRRRSF